MKDWLKISLLLCVFGFLKELRPSESFIFDFLTGEWRNITAEEVNRDVFPIGTYSYLAQLVIVFLITDFLRYKPLIIVAGISGIIVWSLMLWTTSLLSLQILEVVYGTYMATEVAYYTYIYAKVDRKYYQKVSSHTRVAIFFGRFIGSALAQLLVYFKLMNYRELNYLTFATQISATVWAIFLPSVKTSLYFHRKPEDKALCDASTKKTASSKAIEAFLLLYNHFKQAYTNKNVIKWSFWYAMGMCGYLQVISYIQLLWSAIDSDSEVIWNGAVEAAVTLSCAIVAFLAGFLQSSILTQKKSLILLSLLSMIQGGFLLWACFTNDRIVAYICYFLFTTLYSFLITISSAEIAKHLIEDSFGLVFGINTLFALSIQSVLTFFVTSENIGTLTIFQQFFIYGLFFTVLGFIYFIIIFINFIYSKCGKSEFLNDDNN